MQVLDDGTVIPTRFKLEDIPAHDSSTHFGNSELRFGEVQEILLPTDKRNFSQRFVEYTVLVQERRRGTASTRRYSNCVVASLFGGLADKLVFTLRADKLGKGQTLGLGSKVLILCINGETNNAVIIGGLRDSQDTADVAKGHYLDFAFNGLDVGINDAGELTVTFNGKTKKDGTLDDSADEDASGSMLQFQKDGSILLQKDDQSIKIDKSGNKISVKGGDVEVEATGKVTVKAAAEMMVQAGGALTVAAASIALTPAAGAGCTTGDSGNAQPTLMGQAFRDADQQMNSQLQSAIGQAIAGLTAAAAAATLAGLGGVASGLATAAAALGQAASAIGAYESSAGQFLSKRNKSD